EVGIGDGRRRRYSLLRGTIVHHWQRSPRGFRRWWRRDRLFGRRDIDGDVGNAVDLLDGLANQTRKRGVISRRELQSKPYPAGGRRRNIADRAALDHVAPRARVPNAAEGLGDSVLKSRCHA